MPHVGTHGRMIIENRRRDVASRYLRGESQGTIATVLGITQAQISYDLKAIREAWLQSSIRDFDAAKAQELAKVDETERHYWAGWERSQQQREVSTTEATEDTEIRINTNGEIRTVPVRRNKAMLRKEGQAGDPRFLDGVLRCIERRCDILGLSTAASAAKELSEGLASLLVQAKQTRGFPGNAPPTDSLAEA